MGHHLQGDRFEREGYIAPSGQPADVSRMSSRANARPRGSWRAGEIRTQAYVDVPAIVRGGAASADRAGYGFDGTTCVRTPSTARAPTSRRAGRERRWPTAGPRTTPTSASSGATRA
ncbi:MAG: hypothetical protein ACLSVD_12865 [Eggerthellaceae bacterium]